METVPEHLCIVLWNLTTNKSLLISSTYKLLMEGKWACLACLPFYRYTFLIFCGTQSFFRMMWLRWRSFVVNYRISDKLVKFWSFEFWSSKFWSSKFWVEVVGKTERIMRNASNGLTPKHKDQRLIVHCVHNGGSRRESEAQRIVHNVAHR